METFHLNVYKREQGSLFQERTVETTKGLTLTITNRSSESLCGRSFRFLHAAVHELGQCIVAGDQSGAVYMFDVEKNRFWLMIRLGKCCSAIAFTYNSGKDIIVATTDSMLHLLNSMSGKKVASVQSRQSCISHISVDKGGERVLTSSLELAILWDLKMLSVLHNLTVKKSVDFVKVFFLPEKNHIVSAFKDGSVFLWDSTNLACLSQFSTDDNNEMKLRCIEATRDGELIVCAGKVDWIIVWSVESREILFTMTLGVQLAGVRQLAFLSTGLLTVRHHQLAVLSQEGDIFVYVLETATLVLQTAGENCSDIEVASKGNSVVAITPTGWIKIYDLEKMLSPSEKAKPSATQHSQPARVKEDRSSSQIEKFPRYQLDVNRLLRIVREFGEYPPKYRYLVWQHLLQLPDNKEAFATLVERGEHRLCQERIREYTIVNQTLKTALLRILSYLTHWCPLLAEVEYIPLLVFPFVKLLHRNLQMCFEIVLTLICNWCQNWFMYFPHIPLNILCAVENLLIHHDKQLMRHYVLHNITAQTYGWPLLYTVFSELFSKDQWLQLWDHVISNEPSFLLYLVVAYSTVSHQILLGLHSFQDIKEYFQQHSNLPVSILLKEAYHLQNSTPPAFNPSAVMGTFSPLTQKIYPLFTKYPQFKLNLQVQDRKHICCEEVDYIHQRQIDLDSTHNSYVGNIEGQKETENVVENKSEERKRRHLREIQRLYNMRRDIVEQETAKAPSSDQQLIDAAQNLKVQKVGYLLQKKLLTHQSEENSSSQYLQSSCQKQQCRIKSNHLRKDDFHEESRSSRTTSSVLHAVNDVINVRSKLATSAK